MINSRTGVVTLEASENEVFDFIKEVENLPEWADEFCSDVKTVDGEYKATTPAGEVFFEIEADENTGVIDMYAGPTKDRMALFPTRVTAIPGGVTAFQFTMFQGPEMSEEELEGQYQSLLNEFENLKRMFGEA